MPHPTPLRALLVTTDYPPDIGGLQTYAYRIACELPRGLACVLAGTNHPAESLLSPRTGVRLIAARGQNRWRALLWSFRYIPTLVLSGEANCVVHMQWSTALPSWLLKRLGYPVRYLVLVHGSELLDPRRPWMRWAKRLVLNAADAVVSGSAYTSDLVKQLGYAPKRLVVIPYGNPLDGRIPMDLPPRHRNTPMRLLCMHRLVERKGTLHLLEALEKIPRADWTLDIVGQGPELKSLQARVASSGLSERVRFLPPVSEETKISMLHKSDLFILPSFPPQDNNFVEGLGLALLEAQSLGTPVFAARTGGISEAMLDGITGVLYRAGDSEDLRDKLLALMEDPDRLFRMGSAGPAWVRAHFRWDHSLGQLADLMEEISAP